MKKTVTYDDSINRNGIAVKPKKPFYDWLNYVVSKYEKDPVTSSPFRTIYLFGPVDTMDDMVDWLEKNFDVIFRFELESWHPDEKDWPQKRDINLFKEWFDYEWNDLVLDMEKTVIIKG